MDEYEGASDEDYGEWDEEEGHHAASGSAASQHQQQPRNSSSHAHEGGVPRAQRACENCRKLKARCFGDGVNACNSCARKGVECVYSQHKKRGPKGGVLTALRAELEQLREAVKRGHGGGGGGGAAATSAPTPSAAASGGQGARKRQRTANDVATSSVAPPAPSSSSASTSSAAAASVDPRSAPFTSPEADPRVCTLEQEVRWMRIFFLYHNPLVPAVCKESYYYDLLKMRCFSIVAAMLGPRRPVCDHANGVCATLSSVPVFDGIPGDVDSAAAAAAAAGPAISSSSASSSGGRRGSRNSSSSSSSSSASASANGSPVLSLRHPVARMQAALASGTGALLQPTPDVIAAHMAQLPPHQTTPTAQSPGVLRAAKAVHYGILAIGARMDGQGHIGDVCIERCRSTLGTAWDETCPQVVSALLLLAYYDLGMITLSTRVLMRPIIYLTQAATVADQLCLDSSGSTGTSAGGPDVAEAEQQDPNVQLGGYMTKVVDPALRLSPDILMAHRFLCQFVGTLRSIQRDGSSIDVTAYAYPLPSVTSLPSPSAAATSTASLSAYGVSMTSSSVSANLTSLSSTRAAAAASSLPSSAAASDTFLGSGAGPEWSKPRGRITRLLTFVASKTRRGLAAPEELRQQAPALQAALDDAEALAAANNIGGPTSFAFLSTTTASRSMLLFACGDLVRAVQAAETAITLMDQPLSQFVGYIQSTALMETLPILASAQRSDLASRMMQMMSTWGRTWPICQLATIRMQRRYILLARQAAVAIPPPIMPPSSYSSSSSSSAAAAAASSQAGTSKMTSTSSSLAAVGHARSSPDEGSAGSSLSGSADSATSNSAAAASLTLQKIASSASISSSDGVAGSGSMPAAVGAASVAVEAAGAGARSSRNGETGSNSNSTSTNSTSNSSSSSSSTSSSGAACPLERLAAVTATFGEPLPAAAADVASTGSGSTRGTPIATASPASPGQSQGQGHPLLPMAAIRAAAAAVAHANANANAGANAAASDFSDAALQVPASGSRRSSRNEVGGGGDIAASSAPLRALSSGPSPSSAAPLSVMTSQPLSLPPQGFGGSSVSNASVFPTFPPTAPLTTTMSPGPALIAFPPLNLNLPFPFPPLPPAASSTSNSSGTGTGNSAVVAGTSIGTGVSSLQGSPTAASFGMASAAAGGPMFSGHHHQQQHILQQPSLRGIPLHLPWFPIPHLPGLSDGGSSSSSSQTSPPLTLPHGIGGARRSGSGFHIDELLQMGVQHSGSNGNIAGLHHHHRRHSHHHHNPREGDGGSNNGASSSRGNANSTAASELASVGLTLSGLSSAGDAGHGGYDAAAAAAGLGLDLGMVAAGGMSVGQGRREEGGQEPLLAFPVLPSGSAGGAADAGISSSANAHNGSGGHRLTDAALAEAFWAIE